MVFLSCCLGIFLLGGLYWLLSTPKESQVVPTFRNHQASKQSSEAKTVPQSSPEIKTSTTQTQPSSLSVEQTLRMFAESYINYESINERNLALLPLVTENYAKENVLKTPISSNLSSSGQVIAVFQDKNHSQKWLVQVEQAQEGTNLAYMLELELDEQEKISQMSCHLYKLAY